MEKKTETQNYDGNKKNNGQTLFETAVHNTTYEGSIVPTGTLGSLLKINLLVWFFTSLVQDKNSPTK